ncbi:methyltransferase domain-containing protein [Candidatus Fermentibacteria bacterium]|nr:methyltransferase domain-containing protein [Candidatus Fermentibacteria bacterium]
MSSGLSEATSSGVRPLERQFFREYWGDSAAGRRAYGYQWFLRPCRSWAFDGLRRAPPGSILELGSGMESTCADEQNPAAYAMDIVNCRPATLQLVLADAQVLPLRTGMMAAVWEQTMLMHVEPRTVVEEVYRVLMPGGVFAVVEPLAGHPLVSLARRALPGRHVRPRFLSARELDSLGSGFMRKEMAWFFLLSPLVVLLSRRMTPAVRWLQNLDARLMGTVPALRHRAWYAAGWFQK